MLLAASLHDIVDNFRVKLNRIIGDKFLVAQRLFFFFEESGKARGSNYKKFNKK